MNIALCLYGESQCEVEALNRLLNSIQGFTSCDLFIYTWKRSKAEDLFKLKQYQDICTGATRLMSIVFAERGVPEIGYDSISAKGAQTSDTLHNFYARKLCCIMREMSEADSGVFYDAIVMCQAGICLDRTITLPKYLGFIEKGYIVLPDNTFKANYIAMEEYFALGNADPMLMYCSVYDFLEEYEQNENSGCKMLDSPGEIMMRYLYTRHVKFGHGNFRSAHLTRV
ncbi:MAG: hypothetical protein PHP95_13860 [Desulfuromonadaceae bacterium]|nr:hypothetical protein [Desulfuromonadaceae bacterium]MDD2849534.1 hypothetical protein [Desulfuromonadaceae bacterium]MDD4131960.1 hypothetical protein [Desulfuromonadaceae bacterium]